VDSLLNQQIPYNSLPKREIVFLIELHPFFVQKMITITVNKARTIIYKMKSRFKWFSQCKVHPLAEAITKKFTMKNGVQKYSIEKITQTPICQNLTIIQ
jgi:hypothetical protein